MMSWPAAALLLLGGSTVLLFAGIPVAFWTYRREFRKNLRQAADMTICPKCDAAGQDNAGAACDCGGTLVAQSSVRRVDDERLTP